MLMADVDVAVNVAVDAGVTTVASAPLSIFWLLMLRTWY